MNPRLTAGLRRAGLPLTVACFAAFPFAAGAYAVDVGFFFGVISDDPISSIEIMRDWQSTDPIMYDNLVYKHVPEPATLIVLAMGAAGQVYRRRRAR